MTTSRSIAWKSLRILEAPPARPASIADHILSFGPAGSVQSFEVL